MNLIINKKNIDLTPALETYLQKKFSQLEKLVIALGGANPAELTIDIERTTNHHRKGLLYLASAKLHLAKITLRAEEEAEDIRTAIDAAKDTLREEIEKYKDRNLK
jgi:putative sigma-54 modulation protein